MIKKPPKNSSKRSCYHVAVGLLTRREHSEYEMRNKLKLRDFSEDEIDLTIDRLLEGNWLNEERFVEALVYSRKNKAYGPLRAINDLQSRGISDKSLIARYVEANSSEWFHIIEQYYAKHYAGIAICDIKEKSKRIRHLQARGFNFEHINSVLDDTF